MLKIRSAAIYDIKKIALRS